MKNKVSQSIASMLLLGVTASFSNADLVAYWPMDEGAGALAQDLADRG